MAENGEGGAQQQGQEPRTFTQDEVNELMGKVRRETRAAPRTRGDDSSRRLTDYLAEIVGYNARAARTIYNDLSEIFAYSVEKYAKGGRGDVETAMFETARRKNARS